MKSIEHNVPPLNSDPTIKQSETENLVTFKMKSPHVRGPPSLRSHRWTTFGPAVINAMVVQRCWRGRVNWETLNIELYLIAASGLLKKGEDEEEQRFFT